MELSMNRLPMNRDINPNITNIAMIMVIGIVCFLLWKTVFAEFDNPTPPEIHPGPTGHMAPIPREGLPRPGGHWSGYPGGRR